MATVAAPFRLHDCDRIAVVAPHPDDDVLGCGALLAAATAMDVPISVVYVTDGSQSHPRSLRFPPQRMRALRECEALAALARCGVASAAATFLRFPDGRCASLEANERSVLRARLAGALVAFEPTIVFAPWRRDPHPDHRTVAGFVSLALSDVRERCGLAPRSIAYPIWLDERGDAADRPSSGEVRHYGFAYDASAAARKRAAIAAHRSQTGALVHDDPNAFALSRAMIERACTSPEAFYEAPYA